MSPNETALQAVPKAQGVVTAEQFSPIFSVEQIIARKRAMESIISNLMVDGVDYGAMPGSGRKEKVLKKAGAEKLMSTFGLTPRFILEEKIEDWTGKEHDGEALFYYRYTCQLWRGDFLLAEAAGSCTSWESKHRYRWVAKDVAERLGLDVAKLQSRGGVVTMIEPEFAIDKAETTGRFGKPMEYWQSFRDAITNGTAEKATKAKKDGGTMAAWAIKTDTIMYRVPNQDFADVINTCQKIGQKRAMVAAVLIATNCSDRFTQDLEPEDLGRHDESHAGPPEDTPTPSGPAPNVTIPEELAEQVQKFRGGDKTAGTKIGDFLQTQLVSLLGTHLGPETWRKFTANKPNNFKTHEAAREFAIGVFLEVWLEIERLRREQAETPIQDEPAA